MILRFVPNRHWKKNLEDSSKKKATLQDVLEEFGDCGKPVLAAYIPQDWDNERTWAISVMFKGTIDEEQALAHVQVIGNPNYQAVLEE